MAWTDNFDSYPLLPLAGISRWLNGTYPNTQFVPSTAQKYSGAQSLKFGTTVLDQLFCYLQPAMAGLFSCRLYLPGGTCFFTAMSVAQGVPAATPSASMIVYNGVLYCYTTAYNGGTTLALNAWHLIEMDVDVTNNRVRYRVDGGSWNGYYTGLGTTYPIGQISMTTQTGYGTTGAYIDDLVCPLDEMYNGRGFLSL